jgi:hypothetical protein
MFGVSDDYNGHSVALFLTSTYMPFEMLIDLNARFHFCPFAALFLSHDVVSGRKNPQKKGKKRQIVEFLAEFQGFLPFFGLHFSIN